MPCHRCSVTNCSLQTYFMRWAHGVVGLFEMCEECVELYRCYVVEANREDEDE